MTEKSIAQIVAEIKAKIPEIDVQLSAIEVGELPEELNRGWEISLNSSKRLNLLVEEIWEYFDDNEEVVRAILFDLRGPLGSIRGALEVVIYLATDTEHMTATLTSDVLNQLQSVVSDVRWITENFADLIEWYHSQWHEQSSNMDES